MERIAEALGMDPVRLREMNALRPGDTTATGQALGDDCSARQVLREARPALRVPAQARGVRGDRPRASGSSLFYHGSGFTGSGELKLGSRASLELTATGVRILASSTEIGQGTRTMHAQIVADALGIPYEEVEVAQPDTGVVPDSGPTVASRTCMVVGEHPGGAARGDARTTRRHAPGGILRASTARCSSTEQYEQPDWIQLGRGQPTAATPTRPTAGAATSPRWRSTATPARCGPLRLTGGAPRSARRFIPRSRAGRSRAAPRRASGYALLEHVVMRDGAHGQRPAHQLHHPHHARHAARWTSCILENPYPGGPFGAKGLGELPMDGPAPAVVNAHPPARTRRARTIPAHSRSRSWRRRALHAERRARSTSTAHPMARLLDVLREECGLTGTKEGCGEGECGACTVLIDGAAGLQLPRPGRAGRRAPTSPRSRGSAATIRCSARSWSEVGAQCGICTPGMIMAARALGPRPSLDEDPRPALAGNLCRCTGYEAIYRAHAGRRR